MLLTISSLLQAEAIVWIIVGVARDSSVWCSACTIIIVSTTVDYEHQKVGLKNVYAYTKGKFRSWGRTLVVRSLGWATHFFFSVMTPGCVPLPWRSRTMLLNASLNIITNQEKIVHHGMDLSLEVNCSWVSTLHTRVWVVGIIHHTLPEVKMYSAHRARLHVHNW